MFVTSEPHSTVAVIREGLVKTEKVIIQGQSRGDIGQGVYLKQRK